MIPAWASRLLPQIGICLFVIATLWWIDRQGYRRAMADRDARDARMLEQLRVQLRATEQRLAIEIDALGNSYEAQRLAIAKTRSALRPIIVQEATHAPHLSDPAAGVTPGLLDAINRARAAGACAATTAGGIECAVPAPSADKGNGDR